MPIVFSKQLMQQNETPNTPDTDMNEDHQEPGKCEQELRVLAVQERKLKGKWESFKKGLRRNKPLDLDDARNKFDQEKSKYEGAVELIEKERTKIFSGE